MEAIMNQQQAAMKREENREESVKVSADNLVFSHHANHRKAQRGIREDEIALAVRFGKRYWKEGKQVYFLGRRNVPKRKAKKPSPQMREFIRRAEGTVVIVSQDGCICTVFRDRRYPRRVRYHVR
jgi:hypothetical protein